MLLLLRRLLPSRALQLRVKRQFRRKNKGWEHSIFQRSQGTRPWLFFLFGLRQNWPHDMTLNIRKSIVTALKPISQLFVIDSEKVKKGSLEIVDVNRVVCDVEPNVV